MHEGARSAAREVVMRLTHGPDGGVSDIPNHREQTGGHPDF
jgi:hypothetical protein